MGALMGLLKQLFFLMWILAINSVCANGQEKLMKRAIHNVDFFKLRLHQKLETDRLRRSYDMNDERGLKLLPTVLVRKVKLPGNTFQVVKVWFPVNVNGKENVFAVSGDRVITYFEEFSSISTYLFPLQEIYSLQAFQDGLFVWLVTLHRNEHDQHFMQLHQHGGRMPVPRQMEGVLGPSLLTIVRVQTSTYLVLLSNIETVCLLKLFLWSGTQFVFTAKEIFAKRCSALDAWNVDVSLHIGVGFEGKNMAKILVFNKTRGNFSTVQYLGSCHVIHHFIFLGNHHLICGTGKASLYWWSNSKFMKLQEFSNNSTALRDAAVYSLSAQSLVLILAWKDKIEFYFQDLSSRYIKFHDISFGKEEIVKSLKLWRKVPVLFILPVLEGVHPTIVYEVHMSFNSSRQKNELQALRNCTFSLNLKLNVNAEHIEKLSSKTNKIFSSKNHTSVSSIFINGSVISKSMKAQKIVMSGAGVGVNKFFDYKSRSTHFKKLITALQNSLTMVVLKTGNQEVKSNVSFTRSITAFQGNVKNLSGEAYLNGVKASLIPTCLKTNGRQRILSQITLDALSVGNMNAVSINDKQIENLLILNKPSTIKGYLTLPHISVKNVSVSGTINNINVSQLVLCSKSQSLYGRKRFDNVVAGSINAKKVNRVNISSIKPVHLTDSKIDHSLNFTSKLVLHNASVTVRGFDLAYLLTNVVTKDKDEIIRGHKTLQNFTSVKKFLTVTGLVNKVNMAHLMLKYAPQIIHGNIVFLNASFQEIVTDSVNNLDLSTVSVKKSAADTLKGKIKFLSSLSASNVLLKENVLLDYVDPSKVAYDVKSCSNLTSYASIQIGNAIVKGDATVRAEKLDPPFFQTINEVWLKSSSQNISYAKFKNISANQMEVKLLNGTDIMDIVPVDGDAVIDSTKWFGDNLSAETLNVTKGKNISLPLNGLNEKSTLKVLGEINVPNWLIRENLTISSSINNISMSDIMTVFKKQVCNCSKVFQTVKTKKLRTGNISFAFYNRADLGKVFEDSVVFNSSLKMIKNKRFQSLIGKDLNVTGFLRRKNCTHAFQNFVTLNSYQEIHAHHAFKSLTSKRLYAKNLDNIFKKVVYKDEATYVTSRKTFRKGVFTKTVSKLGKVNGIDLAALQSNAFMKYGNISMKQGTKFLASLTMDKLYLKKYSTIDGISLDDLISVHENGTLDVFNASSLTVGNVTINGCFDACCLRLVLENALYFSKDFQKITRFRNLEINGDAIFSYGPLSHLFNEASLMTSDFYGEFVFEDIKSLNVQVLGAVNDGIDLDFMFQDCVNHKTSQIIPAKKVFSYLRSTNASVTDLTVKTIFNKAAKQFFGLNKNWENATFVYWRTLPNFFAKNVTVHGTMNKIKLPEDVVLTDGDAVIYANVSVNSTINVTSGIQIDGSVNGMMLDSFLKQRATLSEEENITSEIIFENDTFVKRNLETTKINNISLTNVLMVKDERNLSGIKSFQNVSFQSGLVVQEHFNGFNLSSLASSLAKISGAETIEMITFNALNVTSLSNTSVNGVSADELCHEMHDVDSKVASILSNLTDKMNSLTEDLSFLKEESENEFTMFEFFTLHQVLKPQYTQRFLPVFQPGTFGEEWEKRTSQMVVWTEKKYPTCYHVQSHIMDVLPDGTLDFEKRLRGKVYPFSLQMQLQNITGFWVHIEQINCSVGAKKRLMVNTVYGSTSKKKEIVLPSNASISDVRLFEDEEIYLMLFFESGVSEEKIYVYEYEMSNNSWAVHQMFHSDFPSSHDFILEEGEQLFFRLAVSSAAPNSSISVYTWVEKKFELFVHHPKPAISAVLWVQKEKELFLILARANTTLLKENRQLQTSLGALEVLALVDDLILDHTVSIHNVHALQTFHVDGEIFVLAVSRQLQVVYILRLRGRNGFQIVQEIPAPGAIRAAVFTTEEEDEMMLAVSSSTGHTRILKAVVQGNHFLED